VNSSQVKVMEAVKRRYWGLMMVGLLLALTLLGLFFTPYDPNAVNIAARFQPPDREHLLGTDHFGRDVLSRILWGARISLAVGIAAVCLGAAAGVFLGSAAGFFGGWWDELLMRLSTALQALPSILLALLFAAVWSPGVPVVLWGIALGNIPSFLRVTRNQVLSIKERPYVEAARALGAGDLRIVLRHIFPNLRDALLVQFSVSLAGAILAEASLSYLGVGIQPPDPSWGRMLREAQPYGSLAPWLVLVPGLFIAFAVVGFNLLGDTWILGRERVYKGE
jgi:peptide/nickel transport system permease protein